MAATNFAALQPEKKVLWSRGLWIAAREQTWINRFMGQGPNNVVQRITDLTKTEKGEKVIFSLVGDLVDDGVIGDNLREGNEEALDASFAEVTIDLISHSVKNTGKLSNQKSVVSFREVAKERLANWLAERVDELAFLTLSGITYDYRLDGSKRVGSPFPKLSFAADVEAPSAKRHMTWTGKELIASDNTKITSDSTLKYAAIVDMVAYAKTHKVKPLMSGGKQYYVLMVSPYTLAQLKNDADYQRAITTAGVRGDSNPWFTGGTVTIDGLVIHETDKVYSTVGAPVGEKWGDGSVNGTRSLLCGAQALAMADIGTPEWVEKSFDYGSKQGINVDKMLGFVKPKFRSNYDKTVEDFGVLSIDHYIKG